MTRRGVRFLVGALLTFVMVGAMPASAQYQVHGLLGDFSVDSRSAISTSSGVPIWLEPRGLNIVDLVGGVPESDLAGAIIQYTPGYGILRYMSGSRNGNTVTITATAYPRFYTDPHWNGSLFGCLGQPARIDELGSVAPATTLRVYTLTGQEITRQVDGYYYVPAGLTQPIRNPCESESSNQYRYQETGLQNPGFTTDGALMLPANMGCELLISYRDYRELTLVFTAEVVPVVSVTVLGRQSFQFPVYFGPGFVGHLEPLRKQLVDFCSKTLPRVSKMTVPPGADYFLLNFPPMPADPFTAFPHNPLGNIDRPTGITYRIATARGLSVDHVFSAGLPLYSHWIDMDQAPHTQYLPYTRESIAFEGLEPLLPSGVSYDPCMVTGTCSATKLAQICNTTMTAQMIYLQVDRIQSQLSRIPLQIPGPAWTAGNAGGYPEIALEATPQTIIPPEMPYKIYLPGVIRSSSSPVEPDDPADCGLTGGCGWFTLDGRMVDYIPLP